MCLRVSYEGKKDGKIQKRKLEFILHRKCRWWQESDPELDPDPDPDPDPLVRGTDPSIQIRIRNKMSRIPNTAGKQ